MRRYDYLLTAALGTLAIVGCGGAGDQEPDASEVAADGTAGDGATDVSDTSDASGNSGGSQSSGSGGTGGSREAGPSTSQSHDSDPSTGSGGATAGDPMQNGSEETSDKVLNGYKSYFATVDEGPAPSETDPIEAPIERAGDDPYQCIWEETVDAVQCGTETIVDGAICGYETVRDGTLCGTRIVEDAALCGTRIVKDAAVCGYTTVASAVDCGTRTVTSAAQCGTRTVTSAFHCGTKTITSGAECGWNEFLSWFGVEKEAKSCNVAATCQIADTCSIANTCNVANTCAVANSCAIDLECDVEASCDVAKSCDVQICKQTEPGGVCTPGLAECDIEGFACQVSADSGVFRCLPNYDTDMNPLDRQVCESLYSPVLAETARIGTDTMAFSNGTAAAAIAGGSYEVGTVYGENGEYGCFVSTCVGGQTDVAISAFTNLAAYVNWNVFAGTAKASSFGLSIPFIELGFTTAAVTNAEYDEYIGHVNSVSLGLGLAPAQVGHMSCNTTVIQTRSGDN